MADRNGYIGRAPSDSSVVVARQVFEPTGVQTDFTFASGYTVGYLDAYLNGARLIEGQDYTATNGSVVGLTSFAQSGDVLELVAYKAFNIATIDTAPGNLTVGTNLEVGGYISAGGSITGSDLEVGGYISAGGSITGSAFYGDGSNLSGLPQSGVGISSAGTNIGYGITTLNFIGVGNTFALNGTTVDISIQGGGGGGITSLDITSSLFI